VTSGRRDSLSKINAYNPGLSSAWMLQRAMSVPSFDSDSGATAPDPDFVNRLLGKNFAAMADLGPEVLRPFLQDVVQAGPLSATLVRQVVNDPLFVPAIFGRVGIPALADWFLHFTALTAFTALHSAAQAAGARAWAEGLPPKRRFVVKRLLEQWEFGSGMDYWKTH
jgi:lycopene cyclase CruP